MTSLPGCVTQQHDRFVQMTDNKIGPAIVVEIADGHATRAVTLAKIASAGSGHVLEANLVGLIHRLAVITQQKCTLLNGIGRFRVLKHVTADENEIFVTIQIKVEKARSPAN